MDPNTKMKTHAKLGFSSMDTADIVTTMNHLIANYHVFYQKLRNYHWNVTGPDFFNLHEQFELLYTEAVENIDAIAERIRVFGAVPMSTLKEYLEVSEILETPGSLSAMEMTREVLKDMETLDSFMLEVVDAAGSVGDAATMDMMNTMVRALEKEHWMLTVWLNESKKAK
ncbi:MAG: DNA starvation/stationary phase protection protein [Bacteroidales bacterium]|nr:DNA starvation/stationary phase protection protein [Bacteroidales bacterium]